MKPNRPKKPAPRARRVPARDVLQDSPMLWCQECLCMPELAQILELEYLWIDSTDWNSNDEWLADLGLI